MTGQVIVVGDIVTDVLALVGGPISHASDTPAQITITSGGAGANTAAWLATIGVDVTLCGVIGDDEPGDIRLAELEVRGVTCAVRRDSGASTGSIVVLADGGERTMLTDRGANLRLSRDDVEEAFVRSPEAVHLHLSGYPLLDAASRPAALHALHAARERGLTTSVDAASAGPLRRVGGAQFLDWVRGTDTLFANSDEARALLDYDARTPAEMARELARTCGVAVIKLGAEGALSYSIGSGAVATVPAAEAVPLDTTGAGDAFAAGYLGAWIIGARGRDALAVAAELGAAAVESIGAAPTD